MTIFGIKLDNILVEKSSKKVLATYGWYVYTSLEG